MSNIQLNRDTYQQYDHIMVLDLEATCCNAGGVPRQEMEIIEIGAVMLETKGLQPLSEFQAFIKPVRHAQLTSFCKELTSITQEQVDKAPNYNAAIEKFKKWMKKYENGVFGSWGDYDKQQFVQDALFHQTPFPIAMPHVNLKREFSANRSLKKRYGMAGALRVVGLPLNGTHHRGIDDARNIAKLVPYIVGVA